MISSMKAAIFEKPGLENLKVIDDVPEPKLSDNDVLIKVKVCGINPIDYFVVSGALPKLSPLPHIPGAETSGIVQDVGSHVSSNKVKKGDTVVVHNKVFDGTCDMCLSGLDMLCRNGGLIGVITNGGFAEYISVPERNVFKIPEDLDWDIAASLPVTSLTPYHALQEASLKINEYLLIFGASGNTGMIAVQLGKKIGAKVITVSNDNWIKTDFGASYIINDYDKVVEQVKEMHLAIVVQKDIVETPLAFFLGELEQRFSFTPGITVIRRVTGSGFRNALNGGSIQNGSIPDPHKPSVRQLGHYEILVHIGEL